MPSLPADDRALAGNIANYLIREGLPPTDELIRNISLNQFDRTISNQGVFHTRYLYDERKATPTTVDVRGSYKGEPVMAYRMRDDEILEQTASYAPGNSDKKFGFFKKIFGYSSKPKARLVETETVGGTRRRRRCGKKTRRRTKSSRRSFKKTRKRIRR